MKQVFKLGSELGPATFGLYRECPYYSQVKGEVMNTSGRFYIGVCAYLRIRGFLWIARAGKMVRKREFALWQAEMLKPPSYLNLHEVLAVHSEGAE